MNHAGKCWGERCHLKQEATGDKGSRKVVSQTDMVATKAEMVTMVAVVLEETW